MDDLGERTGRSYRSDTGVDQTSRDVAQDTREAEEARTSRMDGRASGQPSLPDSAYRTVPPIESQARMQANAEELAIMAQIEAKRDEARKAVINEQQAAITAMHARMQEHQADMELEHPDAPVEVPRVERPAPVPQTRTEPSFAFKAVSFIKSLFQTGQRKPA